ncbi:MAG TPA: hypothetical protein VH834_06010 [Solirubrobacteraceae bacterium]
MPSTRLLLTTGDWVVVDGTAEDVTRRLEDASRSTTGTLAWLKEVEDGQALGVSPSHVVLLRPGDA